MLKLDITHELAPSKCWAEIRFDSQAPLAQIVSKVGRHVGSQEQYIKLHLRDAKNTQGKWLDDLTKSLQDYGAESGMILHVYDSDPNSFVATMEETPSGPAFQMSDEAYAKRPGNAREFLSKLKEQRPDLFQKKMSKLPSLHEIDDIRNKFPLGSRCQVGEATCMRGCVAWVDVPPAEMKAKLKLAPEATVFVGIKLDGPFGNTDGLNLDGSILFETGGPRRGVIVPHEDVNLGNYPPVEDPFELDEI